jgi:general secretion pathway protein I
MKANRGFTLLEAIIAMAILALSLMAVFQISSQAVYAHVYAKKLTVATLLARSKMVDLEQELYDKGFQMDDDEQSGDFSEEGWGSYKWRAKIIAPKTNGLSPDQLIGAIFNLPTGGGEGEEGAGMGAMAGLFGGGKPPPGAPPGDPKAGMLGALGPAAGIAQQQFQTMIDTLQKSVREVHLTITWKEGKLTESIDLVTHVVSLGPGSDRNGGAAGAAGAPGAAATGYVRADNGMPVPNPVPGADGSMRDPSDNTMVIPADQFGATRPGPGGLQANPARQFLAPGLSIPPAPGRPPARPGFPR